MSANILTNLHDTSQGILAFGPTKRFSIYHLFSLCVRSAKFGAQFYLDATQWTQHANFYFYCLFITKDWSVVSRKVYMLCDKRRFTFLPCLGFLPIDYKNTPTKPQPNCVKWKVIFTMKFFGFFWMLTENYKINCCLMI